MCKNFTKLKMEAIGIEQKRKASFAPFNNNVFEKNTVSGKQAASDCNAVPLEFFISELHRRVDKHFANNNDETC